MKKLLFVFATILLTQGLALAQYKVAHADFQVLLDTLPSRKAAVQDITRIQIEGQQELIKMKTDFEKQVTDYEQKLQRGELSPTLQQYEESRLQKMQNNLINREKELSELVQRLADESDTRSMELIKKAVAVVAKKKGLNYVLETTSLLYASGTNITNEIVPELMLLDKQESVTPKTNGQ